MCIRSLIRRFAIGVTLVTCTMLLQSACSPKRARQNAAKAAIVDSVMTEMDDVQRELDEKNASLLELTARNHALQDELDQTRAVLDYVERQFISLERGLQSHETKASAVAALAEARLAYDKVIREDPLTAQHANVRHALAKIQQADTMIPKDRYAASVYFSRSAMRLLQQDGNSDKVRIIAVDEANLRNGPGTDFDIVATVDMGTILLELEARAPWYHVETRAGVSGWVHESVTALR